MGSRKRWSAWLFNASMLGYILWLMLPAVQVRLRAVTGVLMMAVFAAGVLLDFETFFKQWRDLVPRALCVAALPLLLLFFLNRGGEETAGFYAQQVMFWFPLLWCALAAQRPDQTAYRMVFYAKLLAFAVTTLTTIGWLIEGVFREQGRVYAYSRSLGDGSEGRQAYLNELMGHNIGGYGFVYASVFALPVTFFLAGGKRCKRWAFGGLYVLQLLMIALSQYTYAILFAAAITAIELLGLLLRALFRKLSVGLSLLCAAPLIAVALLLRVPIVSGVQSLAGALHMDTIAANLGQLLGAMTGGGIAEGTRLEAYATSLRSFLSSPVFGGLLTARAQLGMHSELLDMLAGVGIVGTAAFCAGAWLIGRGMGKGLKTSKLLPHLALQWLALAVFMTLDTVFYAREIPMVITLSIAFAVWTAHKKSYIIE